MFVSLKSIEEQLFSLPTVAAIVLMGFLSHKLQSCSLVVGKRNCDCQLA